MRTATPLAAALLAAAFACAVPPEPKPAEVFRTTERVAYSGPRLGSADPPPPYRPVRAFPKLKIDCPIGVVREPGTDNLFVVHQLTPWGGAGRVLRVRDDDATTDAEVLLTVDGVAYGIAFHPDYANNGYVYVGDNGPHKDKPKFTRVTRYTVSRQAPFALDPKSAKVIIQWKSDGHNGGDLGFGKDGLLYISSGDGTSDSDTDLAGQDMTRLLAKVLRIDVDRPESGKEYSVPADNPWVKTPGVVPEAWAAGFRNPWRLHADRETGDIWVGNNGQDLWEQVYLVRKGDNFGWSVTEGSQPFYPDRKAGPKPFALPIAEHPHSEFRSLTGGVVYRGKALPELRGAYIYGDFSTGVVRALKHTDGKVVWNKEIARTTLQITGFGLDSRGELLVADHGGGLYRLEPTPPVAEAAKFPVRLSETGLFVSAKEHRPAPGLVPYTVNAPLWSDGTAKERFIALPGDATIDMNTNRGWNFPEGTVLVKTFRLPDHPAGTGEGRRIETRLMVRERGQWAGYSYRWSDDQSDAELVANAGADAEFATADGRLKWHYPSRTECMVCHSRAANYVLGLSTAQMNRDFRYPDGTTANQLDVFARLGLFGLDTGAHLKRLKENPLRLPDLTAGLPGGRFLPSPALPRDPLRGVAAWLEANKLPAHTLPRASYPRLADPADESASLEARARAYLHANCAHCHVEAGGGNAQIDLEFSTATAKMKAIDVPPLHHTFDKADARVIAPGDPNRSSLLARVTRRGAGQMPPLATATVDAKAAEMLAAWVRSLSK